MIRPINDVSNAEQKKILQRPAIKGSIETAALLAADLLETAKAHTHCIGLASTQIWPTLTEDTPHIFVAYVKGEWHTFINATSKRHGKRRRIEEGCMSRPNHKGIKIRSERITVKYTALDGTQKTEHFTGIDAIIVQHELDHLTGTLI